MNEHQKVARAMLEKYDPDNRIRWTDKRAVWGRSGYPIKLSTMLFEYPILCTKHCVLHEIAHNLVRRAGLGRGHTKEFYKQFSLLLLQERVFGIRYGRLGHYKEYRDSLVACKKP